MRGNKREMFDLDLLNRHDLMCIGSGFSKHCLVSPLDIVSSQGELIGVSSVVWPEIYVAVIFCNKI